MESLQCPPEPGIAMGAPRRSKTHEEAVVRAAVDDVEFPEAVILVGSSQWRCVTCSLCYSKDVSIDEHIHNCHSSNTQHNGDCASQLSDRATDQATVTDHAVLESESRTFKPESHRSSCKRSNQASVDVEELEQQAMPASGLAVCSRPNRGRRGRGEKWRGNERSRDSGQDEWKTTPACHAEIEITDATSPLLLKKTNSALLESGHEKERRESSLPPANKKLKIQNKDIISETERIDDIIVVDKMNEKNDNVTVVNKMNETTSGGENEKLLKERIQRSKNSEAECEQVAQTLTTELMNQVGEKESLVSVSLAHSVDESSSSSGTCMKSSEQKRAASEATELVSPYNMFSPEESRTGVKTAQSQKGTVPEATELATHYNLLSPEENRTLVKTVQSLPYVPGMNKVAVKDLMKEKYTVIVEKAASKDFDGEVCMDNVLSIPIETPSLQEDSSLFSSSTPGIPEIRGSMHNPLLHNTSAMQALGHGSFSTVLQPPVPGIMFSAGVMQESDASSALCRTCGAEFESAEELRCHSEEMVKFDVVSCNKCGDNFHGLHQLNVHVFHMHEKMAPKFCFLCDADCLDGFELEEHLLEHTSGEGDRDDSSLDSVRHLCKTCNSEVVGKWSDLASHYHTSHNQLFCTSCCAIFQDAALFEEHKLVHRAYDSSAPVVYTCPVSDCFQMCGNKEGLMDHISWHEDRDVDEERLSAVACRYCSAPFRNNISLERHLAETHNAQGLKPFVCELCLEAFGHSLELHGHNKLRHPGIKRYGCAYCDQRFAFRSSHRRHVAVEHDVPATVLHM